MTQRCWNQDVTMPVLTHAVTLPKQPPAVPAEWPVRSLPLGGVDRQQANRTSTLNAAVLNLKDD